MSNTQGKQYWGIVDFDEPCPGCGVKEGELHELGCEVEPCPICAEMPGHLGWVAAMCDHCYPWTRDEQTDKVVHGPPSEEFLSSREPYIVSPGAFMCARCLEANPEFFHVPNEEWQRVVPAWLQRFVLCRDCYDLIKSWAERHDNDSHDGERR